MLTLIFNTGRKTFTLWQHWAEPDYQTTCYQFKHYTYLLMWIYISTSASHWSNHGVRDLVFLLFVTHIILPKLFFFFVVFQMMRCWTRQYSKPWNPRSPFITTRNWNGITRLQRTFLLYPHKVFYMQWFKFVEQTSIYIWFPKFRLVCHSCDKAVQVY